MQKGIRMSKKYLAAFALTVLCGQTAVTYAQTPITECGHTPGAGDYYFPRPLRCGTPVGITLSGNSRLDCRDNPVIRAGGQDGIGINVGGTSRAPIAHVVLLNCGAVGWKLGLNAKHADQVIVFNDDDSTASFAANKTGMTFGAGTTWSFVYGSDVTANTYGIRLLSSFKPRFEKTTVTKNHIGVLAQKTDELSIITSTTNGNTHAGVVITGDSDSSFLDDGPFGKVYLRGGTNTELGCNFSGRIMSRGPTDGRRCETE